MVLQKYLAGILFQNRKLPFRDRLWKFKSSKHGTDFYLICSWTRPSQTKELETRLSYRQFFPMPPKGFFEVQEVNRETLILFSANYLKKGGWMGEISPSWQLFAMGKLFACCVRDFSFQVSRPRTAYLCTTAVNAKPLRIEKMVVEMALVSNRPFLPARSKWYFSFQLSGLCFSKELS